MRMMMMVVVVMKVVVMVIMVMMVVLIRISNIYWAFLKHAYSWDRGAGHRDRKTSVYHPLFRTAQSCRRLGRAGGIGGGPWPGCPAAAYPVGSSVSWLLLLTWV